jgi:hypothetical protein
MKNPTFECSTDEESKDLVNASLFSEDDEDMLMLQYLDYKLRARNASVSMSDALKMEKKNPARYLRSSHLWMVVPVQAIDVN